MVFNYLFSYSGKVNPIERKAKSDKRFVSSCVSVICHLTEIDFLTITLTVYVFWDIDRTIYI